MRILLMYGSIEGQTAKIAQVVAQDLEAAGHMVQLVDTTGMAEVSFAGVDAVILAASVHERRHPRNFEASVVAYRDELAAQRTMLLSVSLNAAFPEGMEEAEDYVTEMEMRTGLNPDAMSLVAGAVRNDRYDYFATQVLRHVLLQDRSVNVSDGPHEFTDWDALKKDVGAFLETAG